MYWIFSMILLWLKAGHIIFVIFWMAGLFMLPRYFIYHQECAAASPEAMLWVEREARLLRIILWPSMAFAWLFGLSLAYVSGAFGQNWFHLKLALVLALSAYQVWLAGYHADLRRGLRGLSGKKLRLINELPAISATVIVILVVLKPF